MYLCTLPYVCNYMAEWLGSFMNVVMHQSKVNVGQDGVVASFPGSPPGSPPHAEVLLCDL